MNPFRWSYRASFFVGFLICAALLGFALYAEHVLGMEPCPLCIFQRIGFMFMALFFLLGALHAPRGGARWFYTGLVLVGALFGIAVAEALTCGRPVLISDQVNIAPEIEADGCGIVEHDTLEGTIHLLERWLALTPEERQAMQQRARITFARRYDMRRNSALILRIFERLRTQTPGSIVHEVN